MWIDHKTQISMGYIKLVQREGKKQAAMVGLMTKQITQPALSHGQTVKVMVPTAMWQNPHILILDEPTNSLEC